MSKDIPNPGLRGDDYDPINQFEAGLYRLLDEYQDDISEQPASVAALLVEYVDSLRVLYDLDLDGGHLSDDIMGIRFDAGNGEQVGWLNAPRTGPYHDLDADAFEAAVDVPVSVSGDPTQGGSMTITFSDEPADGGEGE